VEYLEANDVEDEFHFSAPGAIRSAGDAQIDAFCSTHFLLGHGHQKGLRAYDRTAVSTVKHGQRRVILKTERGATVNARRVVFATGCQSQQ